MGWRATGFFKEIMTIVKGMPQREPFPIRATYIMERSSRRTLEHSLFKDNHSCLVLCFCVQRL